jgi:hypothetical protein
LILLAIFSTLQALYFTQQDHKQADCLASTVQQLVQVGAVRARLNERESNAEKRALLAAAGILNGHNKTPPKRERARERVAQALRHYEEEVNAVERLRAKNPPPAYPKGRC